MIQIFVEKKRDNRVLVEVFQNYKPMIVMQMDEGTGVEDVESTLLEKIEQAFQNYDE